MYWTVNKTEGMLSIALQADVDGWVAFGISPDGRMNGAATAPGSDIAVGFIGGTCPEGCINDYYTTVFDQPKLDKVQNTVFLSASKVDKTLTIEWKRALSTGDATEDQIIDPEKPLKVIWAANTFVPPVSPSEFAKHTNIPLRGIEVTFSNSQTCITGNSRTAIIDLDTKAEAWDQTAYIESLSTSLNISKGRIVVTKVEEVEETEFCPECTIQEFLMPNYVVPAQKTTYACQGYAFLADKKRQVIRFAPARDNANVLHHMVLYAVPEPWAMNKVEICNRMPPGSTPMYAWAPGGEILTMPDEAGVEVGETRFYAVLQVHYDNPQSQNIFRDRSGVKLYLDDRIRQYNAGFVFLGLPNSRIAIPPGQVTWHQSGVCGPDQTNRISKNPLGKLKIFSYAMHQHYIGRQVWTEHFSPGRPTTELGKELHFDFNAQKFSPITAVLLPGDTLKTHCVWDSTSRTEVTKGGEDTIKEMCLQPILYYPEDVPINRCFSSASPGEVCSYPGPCP